MSTLPWFRAYTKMVDDEKLRLLAFEDRWHFIAILCLKGQGVLDANDPLMMRKAAVKMGLDLRTLEEVARRLAEVGLIDQATLQPVKWEDLQQRSDADPTAADRKRRQRQRRREEDEANEAAQHAADEASRLAVQRAAEAAEHDTRDEIVTVTDASRVTCHEVTRIDIDRDIDKESQLSKQDSVDGQNSKTAAPAAPPTPPPDDPSEPGDGKTKTAKRLPDNWLLPKSWGDWALSERRDLTDDDVRRQAEIFADHWRGKGGQDARKVDWLATWRNWIRRAGAGSHGQQQKPGFVPANKNNAAYNAILEG